MRLHKPVSSKYISERRTPVQKGKLNMKVQKLTTNASPCVVFLSVRGAEATMLIEGGGVCSYIYLLFDEFLFESNSN